jgi:hypothetical protein
MSNDDLKTLRKQLISALSGGESHLTFDQVVKDFPAEARGAKPGGAPHTAWQLIEHMRIAQWDILEFSRNPKHESPEFAEGYWPKTEAPPNDAAWNESVQAFQSDLMALEKLLQQSDLFTPFKHGEGQTFLREALLVANHNSYQLGQLVFLKRMLLEKGL